MRPLYVLFVLFFLGTLQPVQAQSECNQITFSFTNVEPCRFRLGYVNSTECYNEIRLQLEQGEFVSYNVAPGFSVQEVSPSELWITHNQGYLPIGTHFPINFVLPYDLTTSIYVAYINYCPPGTGCELFPAPVLESCPDPQNASIIGTKYRECGNLPYINQPVIPDWTIQLLDEMGNLIAEQQTDGDGRYAFYDLPLGQYLVKESAAPGWTPKVPASGEYVVDLGASQQVVRNFGNCPACSCDSITMDISQQAGSGDTSIYQLLVGNSGAYCFESLTITIDTAEIINWTIIEPGWTVEQIGNSLQLTPPASGYIPSGSFIPCAFRLAGAGNHVMSVSTNYDNGNAPTICKTPFSYPSPPVTVPRCGCPAGNISGPEQVVNGGFNVTLPPPAPGAGYTSDYTYSATPAGSGLFSILNSVQTGNANGSFWRCVSLSGDLVNDYFMVVDGSTATNSAVWESLVSVLPSTKYVFSIFANNIINPIYDFDDPIIQIQIWDPANNSAPVAVSTATTLSELPDKWINICLNWTSPANAAAQYRLEIQSLSTSGSGNDFAIDSISFQSCLPACVCTSNDSIVITYSGQTTTLGCGQGQMSPVLPCPTDSVTITGNFGCVNPDGTPCPSTVDWVLYDPNGQSTPGAIVQGAPLLIQFPPTAFSTPGSYSLHLSTLCLNQTDSCTCIVRWIVEECDSCCLDYDLFCQEVMDAVDISVDNANCKATFSIGDLRDCDFIQSINWGDGTSESGQFVALDMFMHNYSQSGTYIIEWLAIEINPTTELFCFEKIFKDTIVVTCCTCPPGSNPGPNLVTNGDFEQGNIFFTSDYALLNPLCSPGLYNVANQSTVVGMCNNWACTDHTTGATTGQFFVADGSQTPGLAAWRQTIPVIAGVPYTLCAFVNNLNEPILDRADPIIQAWIKNGNGISTQLTSSSLPNTPAELPDDWIYVTATWTAPTGANFIPPYQLEFRTASNSFEGNNFALDDISFVSCPPVCTADFNFEITDTCTGKFNFNGFANGVAPYTYQWNFGDPNSGANNTSSLQNPMHQFSSGGTYTVTLVITDAVGCSATYSAPVTVPTVAPQATISGNPMICKGQYVILTAGPAGQTFLWSDANQTTPSVSVFVNNTTTYSVTATAANGCTSVASFTVTAVSCDCDSSTNVYVQNGDFSQGTPNGNDESIGLAANWSGIWPNAYSASTADFYDAATFLSPPIPNTFGQFGGMWCHYSSNPVNQGFREGMMNTLSSSLNTNSGCYVLTFKLACLMGQGPGFGNPNISAYGVPVGSSIFSPGPLGVNNPTNLMLFTPEQAILLGTYSIPQSTWNNQYNTIPFYFDAGNFPTTVSGIDRIFFTRTDSISGGIYVAIDDVCLRPVPCNLVDAPNVTERIPLNIYPNPTPHRFTLELPYPAPTGLRYRLLDLTGRAAQEGEIQTNSTRETIDAGGLPNGMYFLQVLSEGRIIGTEKLLKQ